MKRHWPPPLAPAAYHGVVGKYVRAVEPHTEGDPAAVLIQTLVCAGNAAGRGPHFFVEDTRHGTNLNAVVVGDTATARKGTSLDRAQRVIQIADPDWGVNNDGEGGLSTTEGLINAVRDSSDDDAGVTDKRMLAAMGEFAETLGKMKRADNPLSATLRAAWDGKTLRNRTKNRPMTASEAHVSVIGHITEADLSTLLAEAEIFNGFGNRFLWVMAKRSKVLPFGGDIRVENLTRIVSAFTHAFAWAERPRLIDFDAKTRKLWPRYYAELGESEPGPFGAVTDRAEAQVRRLALVYAVLDESTRIKPVHLRAALEVWRYCEDSAAYLFSEAPSDPLEGRVMRALRGSEWTAASAIQKALKNVRSFKIRSAVDGLIARGLVERREVPTPGRTRVEYRIVDGKEQE